MKSRVLITGGAGFLGSHLTNALVSGGDHVTILDNFSSGQIGNLATLVENSDVVRIVRGDCKDLNAVSSALGESEIVFHLAANPDARPNVLEPWEGFKNNVAATQRLLEGIVHSKVERIVFASTSSVYGEAKTLPTPEHQVNLEPISLYGASKLACEIMIQAYCHTFNKRALILRLANIIGPRTRHGIIYDLIQKAAKSPAELDVLGDGRQAKSFLYIDDAISAIMIATKSSSEPVDVFNIGSNDQIEVRRIAEIILEELDLKRTTLKFTGGVDGGRGWVGDVKNMLLDTTRLKTIGWSPSHNSEEAVRLTVRAMTSEPLLA